MVVVKDPVPCRVPSDPDLVDLTTLRRDAGPDGVRVSLSAEAWRAVLERDLGWQALAGAARLCETPQKP